MAALYQAARYLAWGLADEPLVRAMKRATFATQLSLLERTGKGLLLDLGCGSGFLVELAQERGWEAWGVELAPAAAAVARKRAGAQFVLEGRLETVALPPDPFDAITMFDYLEHVRDPLGVLRQCRELLRPGGALLLTTPLVGGFSHRVMGRRWTQFKAEHLQYFSPASLTVALELTGFHAPQTRPAVKRLSLDYIARHMELYPHAVLTPLARLLRRVSGPGLARRHFALRAGDFQALAIRR